jgi:hypothetical protein
MSLVQVYTKLEILSQIEHFKEPYSEQANHVFNVSLEDEDVNHIMEQADPTKFEHPIFNEKDNIANCRDKMEFDMLISISYTCYSGCEAVD